MFKVGVCIRHKTLATLTTLTSRLISSQVQRGVDHNRWPAHDNQGRIRTERQAALWSPPSDQIAEGKKKKGKKKQQKMVCQCLIKGGKVILGVRYKHHPGRMRRFIRLPLIGK